MQKGLGHLRCVSLSTEGSLVKDLGRKEVLKRKSESSLVEVPQLSTNDSGTLTTPCWGGGRIPEC